MKKTLVAVAALAAVTGALAEVTIGGLLDAGLYNIGTTNSSGTASSTNGVGPQNNGSDELFFTVSEDLGNGIKANARLGMNISATAATSPSNRISYVGVSSAEMGEIQLGQQWKPGFFTALFADPTWLVATSGAGLVGAGDLISYTANSITYTSPSFSGVQLQVQKGYGETANNDAGSTSGYSISYTSGGIYASYAYGDRTLASGGTLAANSVGATADTLYTATDNATAVKSTYYTGSYDFGIAKILLGSNESTVGSTAKQTGTTVGLSANIGAVNVGIISSSSTSTNSSGTSVNLSAMRVAAFYPLSKRTQLYALNGTSKVEGTTRKTAETAVGIKHTF